MEYIRPATVSAILADEFAVSAIRAIRNAIYATHRDWNTTTKDGKLVFDEEHWGVAYLALSCLLDDYEEPEVTGKVIVGSVPMEASSIQMLTKALRSQS